MTNILTENTIAGLTILKSNEIKAVGACFTFIGSGGAGKTTLAASAAGSEYGGRTLFIDAEGGIRSVSDADVEVVQIKAWAELARIQKVLLAGNHGFDTIVYDNLSEYQALSITGIAGATDSPEIQEWGRSTREMLSFIRESRDMSRYQNINIIFLGWDSDEKEETGGRPKKHIAFTPSMQKQFPGIVDTIGHISVLDNPLETRMVSFKPGPKTISKFRRSREENARKIPSQIYYGLDNMPLADILATLKAGKEWPTTKYPSPVATSTRPQA